MGKNKRLSRSRSRSRSRSKRLKLSRRDLEERLIRLEHALEDKSNQSCLSFKSRSPLGRQSGSLDRSPGYRDSTGFPSRNSSGSRSQSLSRAQSSVAEQLKSLDRSPGHRGSAGFPENNQIDEDIISLHTDNDLEDEILQLLGKDPDENIIKATNLHLALVKRWNNTLVNGLDKSERVELLNKYPPPRNFESLEAPELNNEIKQVISSATLKRDNYQVLAQAQLRAGITALGTALNSILTSDIQIIKPSLPALTDAGKLLIDLQRTLSHNRRYIIIPQLHKSVKQLALSSTIDTKLFGADFSEKRKAQKELEKSSQELKPIFTDRPKNTTAQSKYNSKQKIPDSSKPQIPDKSKTLLSKHKYQPNFNRILERDN